MSIMPNAMNSHVVRRLHLSISSISLQFSLEAPLVPLQQPGVCVVVGVSVVVISQSLGSSVTRNSQPMSSHLLRLVARAHLPLAL